MLSVRVSDSGPMERDELLINAVREYPCLYNSGISDFKVQLKKENAWTAIAELLGRSGEQDSFCVRFAD